MANRSSSFTPEKKRSAAASAVRGASWISLVAATTLGLGGVGQVRARITSDSELCSESDDYRLIVQSYSRAALTDGALPDVYARPQASLQRAITPEELQQGIDVQILQVGEEAVQDDNVVVAWVEQGKPDLEFDAMRARPAKGVHYGAADGGSARGVRIVLRRTAA